MRNFSANRISLPPPQYATGVCGVSGQPGPLASSRYTPAEGSRNPGRGKEELTPTDRSGWISPSSRVEHGQSFLAPHFSVAIAPVMAELATDHSSVDRDGLLSDPRSVPQQPVCDAKSGRSSRPPGGGRAPGGRRGASRASLALPSTGGAARDLEGRRRARPPLPVRRAPGWIAPSARHPPRRPAARGHQMNIKTTWASRIATRGKVDTRNRRQDAADGIEEGLRQLVGRGRHRRIGIHPAQHRLEDEGTDQQVDGKPQHARRRQRRCPAPGLGRRAKTFGHRVPRGARQTGLAGARAATRHAKSRPSMPGITRRRVWQPSW